MYAVRHNCIMLYCYSIIGYYFRPPKAKIRLIVFKELKNSGAHSTHIHTSWIRVPLPNLTGPQVGKKFPTFYGTPRFLTEFTSVHHLSLS